MNFQTGRGIRVCYASYSESVVNLLSWITRHRWLWHHRFELTVPRRMGKHFSAAPSSKYHICVENTALYEAISQLFMYGIAKNMSIHIHDCILEIHIVSQWKKKKSINDILYITLPRYCNNYNVPSGQ